MIKKQVLDKDLSPRALRAAVFKDSAQSPITLYSSSAAILSACYLILIGLNPIAVGGLAVGGSLALGSWAWNTLVKGDARAVEIVNKYRQQMEMERSKALELLRYDLLELGDNEAIKQLELFHEKFANFTHVLSKKFKPDEFTYNRYLSIAEQVYLGGIANIEKASNAQRSVLAIDREHISNQLGVLTEEEDHQAVASLKQRLSLLDEQLEKAKVLKRQNEIAMTQLDAVSARLADLDTSSRRNTVDLDDAMNELRYLIARAENYSTKN